MIACLTVLSGCVSPTGYKQVLDTWIGSKSDSLFRSWGLPGRQHRNSDGSKLYQYVDGREENFCRTIFHVDQNDVIQSYDFKGPGCIAREK